MANQFATNYPIPNNTNTGTANPNAILWKLTRLMKAAGWQYRASGIQGGYDTSGIASNDLWGNSVNPNNDVYILEGTSGGGVSGQVALYAGTNGVTLPTSTIPYTNGTANLINPNGGTVLILTTTGWQSVTYTAATGLTTGSSGNLTGCSGGTGLLSSGGTGSASCIFQSNLTTTVGSTISMDNVYSWWCASGPLTVKIPISALPTGNPIRGEIVTQATSGATGEYLGHVWDPIGLTGWMVILPQHTNQNTTISSASNGISLPQGTINVASTTGFGTSGILNVWTNQTGATLSSGSNGVVMAQTTFTSAVSLGPGPIPITVASTAGFPTSGTLYCVNSGGSSQVISYTGTSGGNTFTGCTLGSGTAVTGQWINTFGTLNINTSSNFNTSGGNIYVQSSNGPQPFNYGSGSTTTFQFCNNSTVTGTLSTGNAVYTVPSLQQITYTGISGNSFTGCSGGTGTMITGNNVTGYSATFDNTHTITAGTSGATFTPTGTVTYFQRELVFARNNSLLNASAYYVAADGYLENNQLFSTLATSGGTSGAVWPGGGGTNNTFFINSPVTGNPMQIAVVGTGATTTVITASVPIFTGTSTYGQNSQLCAVNATPGTGVTADGSFYALLSAPPTGTTLNQITGLCFFRLDDAEPGDCDPYAWLVGNQTNSITAFNRINNTSQSNQLFTATAGIIPISSGNGQGNWVGYQARGCTVISRDVPACWTNVMQYTFYTGANSAGPIQMAANANINTIKLVAFPNYSTAPLVREPALLFCPGSSYSAGGAFNTNFTATGAPSITYRQLKGRARWMHFVSVGNAFDTFENKNWIAVSNWVQNNGTGYPCILIGPYDGVSTPIP